MSKNWVKIEKSQSSKICFLRFPKKIKNTTKVEKSYKSQKKHHKMRKILKKKSITKFEKYHKSHYIFKKSKNTPSHKKHHKKYPKSRKILQHLKKTPQVSFGNLVLIISGLMEPRHASCRRNCQSIKKISTHKFAVRHFGASLRRFTWIPFSSPLTTADSRKGFPDLNHPRVGLHITSVHKPAVPG